MSFSIISNPSQKSFVNLSENANIFHHPAWHKTLADSYGFKLFYLVQESKQLGGLDTVLPLMKVRNNHFISLPFTDYLNPILNGDYDDFELINYLQKSQKGLGAKTIEIRWPLKDTKKTFCSGDIYKHTTSLSPDPETVFDQFHRSRVQQCIRKSEREGVKTRISIKWEDVELFYKLHLLNRRRLGVPIQPHRFFENLWKNLIDKGLGFVILAYKDDQLLAGAVFLYWKKTLTYKYSASDSRYWGLRPNNIMLWDAIRWGCKHGFSVFDWGKTDIENEGLRNFKYNWGSKEEIMHYTILSDEPPKTSRQEAISKIIEPIIQNSPLWVCRAIGEVLYRFAA